MTGKQRTMFGVNITVRIPNSAESFSFFTSFSTTSSLKISFSFSSVYFGLFSSHWSGPDVPPFFICLSSRQLLPDHINNLLLSLSNFLSHPPQDLLLEPQDLRCC